MNIHSLYSNFKVGAALRSVYRHDFAGCVVENAAYPEGLCNEAGVRQAKEISIAANGTLLITPCGGCRQELAEFPHADTLVLEVNLSGQSLQRTTGELLSDSFNPDHFGSL